MDDHSWEESWGEVAVLHYDTDGWIAGSAHVRAGDAGDGGRGINTRQDTKRCGSISTSGFYLTLNVLNSRCCVAVGRQDNRGAGPA